MARLFGTDGVRGIANVKLTCEMAYRLGQAAAIYLGKTIVVGRDTRRSGDMLGAALSAGIMSAGGTVLEAGIIPTPGVALLVREMRAAGGAVISASHNPVEFNGIKFFDGNGYKLPDAMEDEIEALIANDMKDINLPTGSGIGKIEYRFDMIREYVDFMKKTVPVDLSGMKIVIDCAEGASYKTSVETLRELGANLVAIHTNPDGTNINTNCGSTHIEVLQKYVVDNGLDIGFAYDGDADRCIAVDHKGNIIDGDKILYVCGKFLKSQGKLNGNTVVTTVMSNMGLYKAFEAEGINYEQTAVGDKYVAENMLENNYSIGGEQSGHVIFSRYAATGDGILTSLMIMEACVEKKSTLCDLAKEMKVYPQLLRNVRVADKKTARENPEVVKAVEAAAKELGEDGRILVRESGTEPLIRVMVEAKTDEICREHVENVIKVMEAQGLVVE